MSKEKQIEEMVRVMNECCNRYDEQGNHIGNKCYECEEWSDDNHCCCSYNRKEATTLYDAGYRKQSEGKWIFELTLNGDDFYECSVCGREAVINGLCGEKKRCETPSILPLRSENERRKQ